MVLSRDPDHTSEHQAPNHAVPSREMSRDEVIPELQRLDLLILGGGGILYDDEARTYLRDVRLVQERGIPTVGYALGAGPLEHPEDRVLVRETLNAMHGITVRDETSKRVLEDVGVERSIEVTADPAILLTPEPFTPDFLHREGVRDPERMVGMSVREPGRAATDIDEDSYHDLLAQAADFIVHRFDADVLFVPMERGDIRHSHAVIAHMTAADRAHVLTDEYRPRQVLGLMDHLDLVVGMRLHFLIFAAISAVPFLPLPYAGKVFDFGRTLGMPQRKVVSHQTAGPLLAAIDELWDNRGEQRARLRERVPALQQRARRSAEFAMSLLDEHVRAEERASN